MNDYTFGNFLYELRTEKGLSQSELGEIMGVSNKTVSKWEMGVSKPRPAMLLALANFFGVAVEELLNGRREEKQEGLKDNREELSFAIDVQMKAYRKARLRLIVSIVLAVLSPIAIIATYGISNVINVDINFWLIFSTVVFILLFDCSVILVIVFAIMMSGRKRLLYKCFPNRTEELNSITHSKRTPEGYFKLSALIAFLAIISLGAILIWLTICGVEDRYIWLLEFIGFGALCVANIIFTNISILKVKQLIDKEDYERAISKAKWLLRFWRPNGGFALNDILRVNISIAYLCLNDEAHFSEYIRQVSNKKVLSAKIYWQCIYYFTRRNEAEFNKEYTSVFLPFYEKYKNTTTTFYADILQLVSDLVNGTAQSDTKEKLLGLVKIEYVRKIIKTY